MSGESSAECHYQNYSIGTSSVAGYGDEVSAGRSAHDEEDVFDDETDDEIPVYANQSTLDRRRANHSTLESMRSVKKKQVPVSTIESNNVLERFKNSRFDDTASTESDSEKCGLLRCVLTTLGITVLIASYTFLGAFLFTAIEGPNASSDLHKFATARNETIVQLATELRQVHPYDSIWKEKIQEYFALYEKQVLWACNHGYRNEAYDGVKKWNFKGSLYFVVSILTTAGTGVEDMVPLTTWGVVLFFIYATIGIPLMIIWLVTVGASFAQIVIAIYNLVCCEMCKRCLKTKTDVYRPPDPSKEKDNRPRLVVPLLFTLLFFLIWIIIGIVVLSSWEQLTYLDSSMHIFSIFSTIGFYRRDLSFLMDKPSSHNREKFATFLSYVVFGFIILTACIRIFYLIIMRCSGFGCRKSTR